MIVTLSLGMVKNHSLLMDLEEALLLPLNLWNALVTYTGRAAIFHCTYRHSSFRDCRYRVPQSSEENMESSIPVLSYTVDGNYNSDGRSDKKLYTTESGIDLDASVSFARADQSAD